MKTTRLFPIVFLAFGLMITPNILRADEAPESTNTAPKQAVVPAVPEDTDFTMIEVEFPELAGRVTDLLPKPPEGMEWRLVWHDEFDGDEIDWENKWSAPEHARVDGYWSKKALSLTGNGFLKMSVIKEEPDRYLSGCLRSMGKYEKVKGFFVARMNTHREVGHWTAFWLFTPEVGKVGNGSVDGVEIDIMEKPWVEDEIHSAIHWDGYGKDHKWIGQMTKFEPTPDGFHTYALWWSDDAYRFYVDGKQTWKTGGAGICEVPTYIKLTDEIGPWGGDIKKASLPDESLVDYVRVYDLFPVDK
ncbi:MAG: glycoside hydrolase family 16 protein [Thermoguttaceae bacterium]|jgi:hypothetical protein